MGSSPYGKTVSAAGGRPEASSAPAGRPAFIITIDTEGDNLWARPRVITTRNAEFLPRFHVLCESHGLRPSYLVDYEMATAPAFREFGKDIIKRRTGEIGMHLHAWNTPPHVGLTADDFAFQPYLMEYPQPLMEEKVKILTGVLEEAFSVKAISHRAGRWGLNEAYARVLVRQGYRVDCSVTPHVSWRRHRGDPAGRGGPDYSRFPREAYFVDLDDISRPGDSALLEVPMTIVPARRQVPAVFRRVIERVPLGGRALHRFLPSVHWLRPNGRNRDELARIVEHAAAQGQGYVEFMLHSSELIPGGSPRFRRGRDVENLYSDLEALFALASAACVGMTLAEYHGVVAALRGTRIG